MRFSFKNILILIATLSFILLLYFINTFIFIAEVNSHSMNNTLFQSDYILYQSINKLEKGTIKRNDILIFKRNGSLIIKRCIGLPGDTIEIINHNSIKVNDNLFSEVETVVKKKTSTSGYNTERKKSDVKYDKIVIPKKGFYFQKSKKNLDAHQFLRGSKDELFSSIGQGDHYFLEESKEDYVFDNNYYYLVGDNRDFSIDSRNYGPVNEKDIVGKYIIKF